MLDNDRFPLSRQSIAARRQSRRMVHPGGEDVVEQRLGESAADVTPAERRIEVHEAARREEDVPLCASRARSPTNRLHWLEDPPGAFDPSTSVPRYARPLITHSRR